ncbi:substrate-binding domain-containing protein [Bacillus licheniformis]|nr:substrate-binding domain-containing protein [Bacillus licheniformis]
MQVCVSRRSGCSATHLPFMTASALWTRSTTCPKADRHFTGNDQVAAGIIKRARYYQYEVPKQLAVLGYDNQSICEVTDPEITTIDIPVEELAQKPYVQW